MKPPWTAFGLMVLLCACHEQVRLESPEWPEQRSYVLAVTDEQGTEVWAYNVQDGIAPAGPSLSLRTRTQLIAVHLGCPLSTIGLAPGPVQLTRSGDEQIPLPDALGVQAAEFSDGEISAWRTLASEQDVIELPAPVAATLQRLPIEQPATGCEGRPPRISTTPLFSESGGYAFSVPLRSNELLVGTRTGESYLIGTNGDRTSNILPPETFVAGHEGADGTIYLLRDDGFLRFGRLSGPFQTSTSSLTMRVIDVGINQQVALGTMVGGSRLDGSEELFAATGLTFGYYNGTDWIEIAPSPVEDILPPGPDLLWLGPGAVLAADADQEGIIVQIDDFDPSMPSERQRTNVSNLDQVMSLQRTSDGTIRIGTRVGRVFQYNNNGDWDLILSGDVDDRIPLIFLQTEFGLLIGRNAGLLGGYQWTWASDEIICDIPPDNLATVRAVWPVGARQWITVNREQSIASDRFGVTLTTLEPPEGPECVLGAYRLQALAVR